MVGCANRISFDLEYYDGDEEALFKDVARILRILTKNDEVCTFEYEDCGIYLLQHNYARRELEDTYPYWLTPEEQDLIDSRRFTKVQEEDNDVL